MNEFEKIQPAILIKIQDLRSEYDYHHVYVQAVPRIDDVLFLGWENKGTKHRVESVEHHIGTEHRIVVYVRKILS